MPSIISFDAGGVLVFPNWSRVSAALAAREIVVTPEALAAADARAKFAMDRPRDVSATDNAGHGKIYYVEVMKAAGIAVPAALAAGLDAVRLENARQTLWEVVGPGVTDVLARLREEGRRLIVVSNSDGRLQALMRDTGLAPFFDLVVDSAEVGVEKPDPRIFTHALAAMGGTAGDAVHVGDFYEIDVVGAQAAGMQAVLLDPYDLHARRECVRVRSLGEL